MILEPKCYSRKCKHFQGVQRIEPDKFPKEDWIEGIEIVVCPAFPNGIPDAIAYGKNLHAKVHPDQTGDLVFSEA